MLILDPQLVMHQVNIKEGTRNQSNEVGHAKNVLSDHNTTSLCSARGADQVRKSDYQAYLAPDLASQCSSSEEEEWSKLCFVDFATLIKHIEMISYLYLTLAYWLTPMLVIRYFSL